MVRQSRKILQRRNAAAWRTLLALAHSLCLVTDELIKNININRDTTEKTQDPTDSQSPKDTTTLVRHLDHSPSDVEDVSGSSTLLGTGGYWRSLEESTGEDTSSMKEEIRLVPNLDAQCIKASNKQTTSMSIPTLIHSVNNERLPMEGHVRDLRSDSGASSKDNDPTPKSDRVEVTAPPCSSIQKTLRTPPFLDKTPPTEGESAGGVLYRQPRAAQPSLKEGAREYYLSRSDTLRRSLQAALQVSIAQMTNQPTGEASLSAQFEVQGLLVDMAATSPAAVDAIGAHCRSDIASQTLHKKKGRLHFMQYQFNSVAAARTAIENCANLSMYDSRPFRDLSTNDTVSLTWPRHVTPFMQSQSNSVKIRHFGPAILSTESALAVIKEVLPEGATTTVEFSDLVIVCSTVSDADSLFHLLHALQLGGSLLEVANKL